MGVVAEGARLLEPGVGPGGASLWERPKRRLGEVGRGRNAGRGEGTPAWGGQEGWGSGEENGSFCRFELGVEEIPVPPNQGPTCLPMPVHTWAGTLTPRLAVCRPKCSGSIKAPWRPRTCDCTHMDTHACSHALLNTCMYVYIGHSHSTTIDTVSDI